MKKKILIILSVLLTLTAIFLCFILLKKDTNKIIATSNYGNVTEQELKDYVSELNNILNPENKLVDLEDKEKELIAKEIINQRKILEDAKKSNVADKEELKNKAQKMYDDLLKEIYLKEKIINTISEEKLKTEYELSKKELKGKKEFRVKHILVATEEEIKKVEEELKNKKFEEVAKIYSIDNTKENGGDLGYVAEGQTVEEFENTIKSTALNIVSKPFKTQFGWHILIKTDEKKIEIPSFEESKDKIEQILKNELIKEYFKNNLESADIKFVK